MIISTGVDLAEVERIQAALEDPRIGKRFRDSVFTEKEIAYCEKKLRGKYESYAGRFAAKEAVMKASAEAGARRCAGSTSKLRARAAANRKSSCTTRPRGWPENWRSAVGLFRSRTPKSMVSPSSLLKDE